MKNKFTKPLPLSIIIFFLVVPSMVLAQSMVMAQNVPKTGSIRSTASSQTKRLKEVLNDLSQKYQVSILFEDATVQGYIINQDKVKGGSLESN